jgi:hypothetical protein
MLHMRKAGGSTVRAAVKNLCQQMNIEFKGREGWAVDYFDWDKKSFKLLNLRHPFERFCSLYNAEGRWQFPASNWSAEHMIDENVIPFDDWFAQKVPIQSSSAPPLWRVPENFYVKTLCRTGSDEASQRRIRDQNINEVHYRSAILTLMQFDLVVICEGLRRADYVQFLSDRMLGSGKVEFEHKNATKKHQDLFDIRQHLTPAQKNKVMEANRWDLELYRFACHMVLEQTGIDLHPKTARL